MGSRQHASRIPRRVREKQTYCVTRAFSPRSRETRVISFDDGTINPPGCVHCHTVTLRNRYVTKSATRLNGAATYRKQDITRVTFQFPSNGIFPALIRPRKREREETNPIYVLKGDRARSGQPISEKNLSLSLSRPLLIARNENSLRSPVSVNTLQFGPPFFPDPKQKRFQPSYSACGEAG